MIDLILFKLLYKPILIIIVYSIGFVVFLFISLVLFMRFLYQVYDDFNTWKLQRKFEKIKKKKN